MGEAAETEAAVMAAVDRVEAEIADRVLKTLKKKAQRLVERLKADPKAERNDRGECVCDDVAVTESNMVDLVNDVLRKRVATIRATPQATQRTERSGRQPRSVAVHAATGAVDPPKERKAAATANHPYQAVAHNDMNTTRRDAAETRY